MRRTRFVGPNGSLASRRKMVTFDIALQGLERLDLPAAVSPTKSPLMREGWVATQVCIDRRDYPDALARIEKCGGSAIVMQDVQGYLQGNDSNDVDRRCKE